MSRSLYYGRIEELSRRLRQNFNGGRTFFQEAGRFFLTKKETD